LSKEQSPFSNRFYNHTEVIAMKRLLLLACLVIPIIAVIFVIHDSAVQAGASEGSDADVAAFAAAHRKYLMAWSDRDIETIVEMGTGAAGFGHSTAFPRPLRVRDPFREGVKKFYASMDVFRIDIETENYRVVGDTGLAWGHYAQTTKQKDGPMRTVYLRYTHTFVRTADGGWQLVLYQRSLIPNEDWQ
jgi:ketosteroid isomerase-like protein